MMIFQLRTLALGFVAVFILSSTATARRGFHPTSSPSTSTGSSSFPQLLLAHHNAKRALHSAPKLSWNHTLAHYAAAHASNCVYAHSQGPYGENLSAGAPYSSMSAKKLFNGWYAEGDDYNYSTNSFSEDDGHFTQIVWKSTKQLGCAVASCDASQLGMSASGKGMYLVCEYYPPGNVQGEYVKKVQPPKSS